MIRVSSIEVQCQNLVQKTQGSLKIYTKCRTRSEMHRGLSRTTKTGDVPRLRKLSNAMHL